MDERVLDGNAVGGLLAEVFALDVTAASGTCASCGAVAPLGAVAAYVDAPGAVLRCRLCGAVLLRVVHGPGRVWLDLTGLRCLELRESSA